MSFGTAFKRITSNIDLFDKDKQAPAAAAPAAAQTTPAASNNYNFTLQTKKFGTFNDGDLRPVSISGYKTGKNYVSEALSEKNTLNQALSSIGGKAAVTQFAGPAGNYLFIPEDFLTKGFASNGNVWTPKGILDPKHLDPFLKQAEYVDFSKQGASTTGGGTSTSKSYDEFFKGINQTPKGFLIPTDAKNGDGNSFENQLYISDPISVHQKLVQQMMGQGTSSKWTGEGAGSPTANAGMMADVLMSAGITDIRDFGKIDIPTGTAPAYVELKDPKDPSKGGYVIEKMILDATGESIPSGKKIELTPERISKIRPSYVQDSEYGAVVNSYSIDDVPVVREQFGNKLTSQPVNANYNRTGGDIFSGTYGGHGRTNFGVQFAPDGTPVFYTQFGGDTSSFAGLREFLPIAGFALNFVFPGAGAALGTALGATGATAAIVGNAIINGAMAEAAGGDFWKAAAGSAIGGAMSGAAGSLPSTGSAIVDRAITGGVTAAITGGDPLQGALNGAITAGINEFVPTTGNKIVDSAVASGINAALTGRDVENALVSGAITGVGRTIRDERTSGAATGSGTSAGSDTTDIVEPAGGAGFDGIDTKTVTDEDGTQFVYDQDNNLVDIIQGTTTPSTPEVETGVSTDTSGAINIPAVTQPPAVDLGISTDTSGAVTTPPVIQPPAVDSGVSTDTSGAVAPSTTQPVAQTPIDTGTSSSEPGTTTVTDEDGTQFVYDKDKNLVDIILGGQDTATGTPPATDIETGVSTDTSGAITTPEVTQPSEVETGVSTDTSGATTVPPVIQPPTDEEAGVSTDTSGAETVAPPVTQPPTEETGISTDTSGVVTEPPKQPDALVPDASNPNLEPGKTPQERAAEEWQKYLDSLTTKPADLDLPGSTIEAGPYWEEYNQNLQRIMDEGGYTSQWQKAGGDRVFVNDDGTAIGINENGESYSLTDAQVKEMVKNGILNTADSGYVDATGGTGDTPGGHNQCSDGFHWDEARQICVADSDPSVESQDCPEGYIYDLGAKACVKATSVTGGGGGSRPPGGTGNAGGAGRTPVTQVQQPIAATERPISRAIVDEPMRRIGLPIYEKMSEFEGPLSDFLEMVRTGSYISKPNQPEQSMQPNMNQQTQPDLLDQPAAPGGYFNYGQESSIDSILNPGFDLQGFARGGMATPLMAAGGTTRYGMNSGGALDVVHHSGKPRLDFRKGAAVTGEGDGQSDDIPAMLADGEFVFPADVVAALGNGSTKAGSDKLYEMMHSIRSYHRSAKPEDLPPPAKKSPLDYLKKPAKKARK